MVEYSPEGLDSTYSALASPVRRDILLRLREGDARVTELAAPFAVSLAAVSKHIRVLEEAQLLRRTVVGRDHRLSVATGPLAAATGWLETYRAFWDGRLDTLDWLLRQRPR